jgi:mono/diheme cytochrome c family protein
MKILGSMLFALALLTGASLPALDLPARGIFSPGPNKWNGEVLEITKGRGAIIGWYVSARREETVSVFIEYQCAQPLDQEYQLSFDGQDAFWEVPVTAPGRWSRAKLGEFRMRSGLPLLVLLVPPSNRKYDHPLRFRRLLVEGEVPGNLSIAAPPEIPAMPDATTGFGKKLNALHPALDARDLRDENQTWRITGMALRSPRELLFTTWEGDVVSLDLDAVPASGPPPFRRLARGLSEPMGLACADGRIFVCEKNQVTELIDGNGDGAFETLRCIAHDWPGTMDYHEYLFGAVVRGSHIYFASSVAMAIRNRTNRQAPLRGSLIKVHLESGDTEIVAGGLRTPNGIGNGPGESLLVTDNQGEWLPANKLIHVQPGAFYQFRSRAPWHPLDRPVPTPPAVWLPQGEIAMSPTEPALIPVSWGPYAGQVVFGDAAFGGLERAFLEEIDGVMQGAAFRFSQGLRHHFNRLVFTADGDLYAGGIARGNDWDFIRRVSGLTKIRYTGKEVFEPLAARLRSNGLEIEFTLPLAEGAGWNPAGYHVTQWGYQGTQTYGGQKVRHRRGEVRSATVSADRRRVFLELPGLVEGEVFHVLLPRSLPSAAGLPLWSGELWYTVNRIPADRPGIVKPAPAGTLSARRPFFSFSEDNRGGVLYQNFCAACHSLDGSKLAGPSFQGLAGSKRRVVDPDSGRVRELTADAAYVRRSILEPAAMLVEGYENIMPPIGAILTPAQVDDLVEHILKSSSTR